VVSEEVKQLRGNLSRGWRFGRVASEEGSLSPTGTDIAGLSVPGCEEAGRLHTDYTAALSAFQKAQDRLLSGWNNTKRRRGLESTHVAVLRARRRDWTHVEHHGCRRKEAHNSHESS
jgi:hypothetical protein